jgi:hypothetical protein
VSFAARFAAPTGEELACLARKYDTLADLRARREMGGGVAPRGELLALAREFPGALRELDTLPIAEIQLRREALAAALGGDSPARWITWMIAYHATMRAALAIKARLARARDRGTLSEGLVRQLAVEIAQQTALPVDEAFVRAVSQPPARRVNAAIFERLGREFGVPAEDMWETLFPARRKRRFTA